MKSADIEWDPSTKDIGHDIELIRSKTNLRGCDDSISAARKQLKLKSFKNRSENYRLCLLTTIFQTKEQHDTLPKEIVIKWSKTF